MSADQSTNKELPVTSQELSMEVERAVDQVESFKGNQDKMADLMKSLSCMVKNFKMKALLLEAEQESLLSMLNSLRDVNSMNFGTPEGIVIDLIDTLTSTLTNVDVKISTDRSRSEEEALHQVNGLINQLVAKVQDDLASTKELCEHFMKFSSSSINDMDKQIVKGNEETGDLIAKFNSMITHCSDDDQQRVRRRLKGLLNYINSLQSQFDQCSFEEL